MLYRQRPWKHDPRSKAFSHQRFFGAVALPNLPATLGRALRWIMYQDLTLRCTGYSGAADGSYIHGRRFSGDWQAAKVGQIQGRSVDINGGDPNAAMKAERDYGFLPAEEAPFSIATSGIEGSNMEAFLRYPGLDNSATKFDNIAGFVRVDGPYDAFDNIRNALYLAYDKQNGIGATVRAFGRWYRDWMTRDGIIPSATQYLAGWHAYNFVDWTTIDGVEYLIIHNSYGNQAGKNGFFYMNRETVNREFAVWGTSLKIVKALKQEWIDEARKETPLGRLWRSFIDILYVVSEKFGQFGGPTADSLMLQVIRLLVQLRDALSQPKPPLPAPVPPAPEPSRLPTETLQERLYRAAVASIGKDLSRMAPDDRGCAESVSRVIQQIDKDFPILVSTIALKQYLLNSQDFEPTDLRTPGIIAVMPTEGDKIGHCWILGKTDAMSNNSVGKEKGTWTANYPVHSLSLVARNRGLKLYYFRMQ